VHRSISVEVELRGSMQHLATWGGQSGAPSRATQILAERGEWRHFQRGASHITSMALLLWRFRAGVGVSADPGPGTNEPIGIAQRERGIWDLLHVQINQIRA
jgi:hypothetical protein